MRAEAAAVHPAFMRPCGGQYLDAVGCQLLYSTWRICPGCTLSPHPTRLPALPDSSPKKPRSGPRWSGSPAQKQEWWSRVRAAQAA